MEGASPALNLNGVAQALPMALGAGNNFFLVWGDNINILKTLLLISATLSLIIGSLLGLAQIRVKRLLAYSTISHIGFILLALAVNTEQSIDSFIFYIIQYTITNLNIFLVILGLTYCLSTFSYPSTDTLLGSSRADSPLNFRIPSISEEETANLSSRLALAKPYGVIAEPLQLDAFLTLPSYPTSYCGAIASKRVSLEPKLDPLNRQPSEEGVVNKDISFINEFKGLFFSNPLLSISLAVSLFSMAGIPPLIGFFSKQLVLYSALQNGYYFISVLAIIVSVISCSYYLQIVKVLFTPYEVSYEVSVEDEEVARAAVVPGGAKGAWTVAPPISYFDYNQNQKGGVAPKDHIPLPLQQLLLQLLLLRRQTSPKVSEELAPHSSLESRALLLLRSAALQNEIYLTNTHSYLISALTFTILLFFIKPSLILNSTQLLSLSLFYI
jgi:NADH:ubiquinone oxidoreductase subunit 5 (subunit L)/multisubunit Na+/H+ antiporter MnhA subunit